MDNRKRNLNKAACTQTALILTSVTCSYITGGEDIIIYEHLTISPVAAQCNGACGKRSSIECVHIDRCWPQKSWKWRLRSTHNLDSDKFRCFNYRDELDCTVFLPNFRLVTLLQSPRGPAPCDSDACYI